MCYLRSSGIQQRGDERERERAITRKTVEEQAAAIALIHCAQRQQRRRPRRPQAHYSLIFSMYCIIYAAILQFCGFSRARSTPPVLVSRNKDDKKLTGYSCTYCTCDTGLVTNLSVKTVTIIFLLLVPLIIFALVRTFLFCCSASLQLSCLDSLRFSCVAFLRIRKSVQV